MIWYSGQPIAGQNCLFVLRDSGVPEISLIGFFTLNCAGVLRRFVCQKVGSWMKIII